MQASEMKLQGVISPRQLHGIHLDGATMIDGSMGHGPGEVGNASSCREGTQGSRTLAFLECPIGGSYGLIQIPAWSFFFAEVLVLVASLIPLRWQVYKIAVLQDHAARNLKTPNFLECFSTKPVYASDVPHHCGLQISALQPYSLT